MYVRESLLEDGTLDFREEIEEISLSNIEYRKYDGSDLTTPTEQRAATQEEINLLKNYQSTQNIISADSAIDNVLSALMSNQLGQDFITVLVARGVITPEEAENAGWTAS